jgi:hypothetical protein
MPRQRSKIHWPTGYEVVSLTGQQINGLLDGDNINLMTPHKTLQYELFF